LQSPWKREYTAPRTAATYISSCSLLRTKSAKFLQSTMLIVTMDHGCCDHHVIHQPRPFTYLCHLCDNVHSHRAMSATVTTSTTLEAPQLIFL